MTTSLSQRLDNLMRSANFNPRSLSLAAGLNATAVRDILQGRIQSPRYKTLRALAKALNTDPAYLAGDIDQPATSPGVDSINGELAREVSAPVTDVAAHVMTADLPVLGTAIGGAEGEFALNGQVCDYVGRPPPLKHVADAYGVYMIGHSMEPKYEAGQLLYIHPGKPVRTRDFVIVELTDGRAFVKRYISRSDEAVVCEQYNPIQKLTYPASQVRHLHKIVAADEV